MALPSTYPFIKELIIKAYQDLRSNHDLKLLMLFASSKMLASLQV